MPLDNRTTQTDRLWGVERSVGSPAAGELVVPHINLWDSPKREYRVGVAYHDDPVDVLGFEVGPDGRKYFKVQSPGGVRGWVSQPFLKRLGDPGRGV